RGSDGVDATQGGVDLGLGGEVLDHLDRNAEVAKGLCDGAGGEDRVRVLGPALGGDGVGGLNVELGRPAPAVQDLLGGVLEEQAGAQSVAAHGEDQVLGGDRVRVVGRSVPAPGGWGCGGAR